MKNKTVVHLNKSIRTMLSLGLSISMSGAVMLMTTSSNALAKSHKNKDKIEKISQQADSKEDTHTSDTSSQMEILQRALLLGQKDQAREAEALLDQLILRSQKEKTSTAMMDLIHLTKGRIQYQQGQPKEAIDSYNQVSSSSDRWPEALEEKAWAQLRLGEYGSALATLKNLRSPILQKMIGAEPYFLEGLVHLKICDYPKIYETLNRFRKEFRARLEATQKLAQTGNSEAASHTISQINAKGLQWSTVAPDIGLLPPLFYKDRTFIKAADAHDSQAMSARLKALAQNETKKISEVLQKMQLLDAEVTQRIHAVSPNAARPNKSEKIEKDDDTLTFLDQDEDWTDALNHYHIEVKGCPTAGGPST